MPHVIVKLWPGKSEAQKTRLAEKIAQDVMDVLNYGEESVSVAFQEVSSSDWARDVYSRTSRRSGRRSTRSRATRSDDVDRLVDDEFANGDCTCVRQ